MDRVDAAGSAAQPGFVTPTTSRPVSRRTAEAGLGALAVGALAVGALTAMSTPHPMTGRTLNRSHRRSTSVDSPEQSTTNQAAFEIFLERHGATAPLTTTRADAEWQGALDAGFIARRRRRRNTRG